MRDDEPVVGAGHLKRAADDHEERHDLVSRLDEHLAEGHWSALPRAAIRATCASVNVGNSRSR